MYDRELYDEANRKHLHDYTLVTDSVEVPAVLNAISKQHKIAFDLETTGLDYNTGSIHGLSLATADREWYVSHHATKVILPELKTLFNSGKQLVIGHNLLFDLHFAGRHGVRPPKIFDTMIAEFLVDENQSLALKNLANTKLNFSEDLPSFKDMLKTTKALLHRKRIDLVSIYDIPLEPLAEYAALDARLTYDLHKIAEKELLDNGMHGIFTNIEMPFIYTLLDMESAGFYIDLALHTKLEVEFAEKKQAAVKLFHKITKTSANPDKDNFLNPDSSIQLSKLLFEEGEYTSTRLTGTGKPSVDIMALTRLKAQDKKGEIVALLDYRKFQKLERTYITPIGDKLYNGRLHSNFRRTGTVTGRLSSGGGVNLQNIPAKGEEGHQVRAMFRAKLGKVMLVVDYSQIELRLLAHFCNDPNMIQTFLDNEDAHQLTATRLGIKRGEAKAVNFGIPYGISARMLQDAIEKAGVERPELSDAEDWISGYSATYPNFPIWQKRVWSLTRRLGYVKTIGGRRRHLPEIYSDDGYVRSRAERQAVNAIIQGSAADIIQKAMIDIANIQDDYDARMLAQVHDELVFEVSHDDVDKFAKNVQHAMEVIGEEFNLRVPLIAEPGIGPNWSEAK